MGILTLLPFTLLAIRHMQTYPPILRKRTTPPYHARGVSGGLQPPSFCQRLYCMPLSDIWHFRIFLVYPGCILGILFLGLPYKGKFAIDNINHVPTSFGAVFGIAIITCLISPQNAVFFWRK